MSSEPLQQANMFTGAWETKRTRSRTQQQMQMFSINETFVFGERVRPWLAEAAAPTLKLICEDVRTPEEIERDLMREAEALNHKTFVETPGMYDCKRTPLIDDGSSTKDITENGVKPEQHEPDNENDHSPPKNFAASEKVTKLSCYHALVNLAHEQAVTLWIDEPYRQRFYAQLPQAILFAQGAGLTACEISAAMQIGEFQGKRERETAPHISGKIVDASDADPFPLSLQTTTREVTPQEGFRARIRREHNPVRTRQSQSTTPEVVPGLWMDREHIGKRLPYLAHYHDHEQRERIV